MSDPHTSHLSVAQSVLTLCEQLLNLFENRPQVAQSKCRELDAAVSRLAELLPPFGSEPDGHFHAMTSCRNILEHAEEVLKAGGVSGDQRAMLRLMNDGFRDRLNDRMSEGELTGEETESLSLTGTLDRPEAAESGNSKLGLPNVRVSQALPPDSPVGTTRTPGAGMNPDTRYTVASALDLLRYQREATAQRNALVEDPMRIVRVGFARMMPVTMMPEIVADAMKLRDPAPPQMPPSEADASPTFARLKNASKQEFDLELDEDAFNAMVAGVASQHGLEMSEVLARTLADFAQLKWPNKSQKRQEYNGDANKPARATKREQGKRAGRKATDPKLDLRVWEAWATGQYTDYAALAAAFKLAVKEVTKAMDRERKRRNKPREQ